MRQSILILILLIPLYSCSQTSENKTNYPKQVGDISFDGKKDDPGFKVCNPDRVFQYYNFGKGLQYKGEKAKIKEHFKEGLPMQERNNESGFLTVRFIVNCEGKTGWFRVQGMDADYQEKEFNNDLVNQILTLTKKLDGWIAGGDDKDKIDYYQYLTFKLENGKLIEIMP